ncbi:MAG TPA: glutamine synthetase [bacterium (Candidatus Stahlbacteria)]|nr:glutamine synthetase [Candidatus Stahlbacteria bacterium]
MRKSFDWVDLKYVDLHGGLHHLTLPYERFSLKEYYGIDGSSIPGFNDRTKSDLMIRADPGTEFIDPFFEKPTLSYLSVVYDPDGKRFDFDPRGVVMKIVQLARRFGDFDIRPELEFYIFRRFGVEHWAGGYSVTLEADDHATYHSSRPVDRYLPIRNEITEVLKGLGIPVRFHHHENGPGQQEIELERRPLTRVCDEIIITRYVISNVCNRHGLSATFLAKPLPGQPGSGLHLHQVLKRGKRSLFGRKTISKTGSFYLGGLLTHTPALGVFANPTTNSYRRLDLDFESPTEITTGFGDRTALVRVPEYGNEITFEFRMGDGTANPYLLIPAMIAAGIDGVRNRIDPDRVEALLLPRDINQAIEYLYADYQFLSGIIEYPLIERYTRLIKRIGAQVSKSPHPLEYEVYHD